MANIDWNEMRWNGKLSWAVDLLYYDKENVDVVHPPYAWRDRNSSFFLKTREWYIWDVALKQFLYDAHFVEEDEDFLDREWDIVDVKVQWNDTCTKDSWIVYYLCVTKDRVYKTVITRTIEDWCLQNDFLKTEPNVSRNYKCSDDKLFVTTYVKWYAKDIIVDNEDPELNIRSSSWWIQINRKEWWVVRWYFTDPYVEDWFWSLNAKVWDYIVVFGSTNDEDSWFCGQVRTIIGKNKSWELMVNAPWLWFKDELDEKWEVRWGWLSYRVYSEYWEVVGFSSYDWVKIIVNPREEWTYWEEYRTLTMCDFHIWTSDAWHIISSTADVDRVYFLYENGYVRYWEKWMNKFFTLTEDAFFVGKDKSTITMYRDMLLAFWRRHIAVALWDDTWTYARAYNQSTSIWLKNRYAYGEYNWDMLFVSNDNRLLALQFESNVWTHMLSFQDVWAYANPYLKAMLPTDEAYIWVDNNELRIFINSKADIDRDDWNSKTMILKYDTIFQTWTVDVLKYFIVRWCYEWLYFWDDVYFRWHSLTYAWSEVYARDRSVDKWVKFDKHPEGERTNYNLEDRDYQVNISAFLLENENNGMSNSTAWTLDLFRLASLQKLMILLWTWRYSELTKIKITEWRWWRWREYEIKDLHKWNDWVNLITYAYDWEQLDEEFIKKKECVIDSLNDGSKQIRVRCEEWHKIHEPIPNSPWCKYIHYDEEWFAREHLLYKDAQLWEHNVCLNDEVYELAPTMPLTIQLWDQENYNTEIKIELISQNGDIINFWWFMALLHLATLWQNMWWDGEYQISVDNSGC